MSLVKFESTDGDSVKWLEANTEESLVNTMGEILWHCWETRQRTEKTNIALRSDNLISYFRQTGEVLKGTSIKSKANASFDRRLPPVLSLVVGF
jgi:hypothetical protein